MDSNPNKPPTQEQVKEASAWLREYAPGMYSSVMAPFALCHLETILAAIAAQSEELAALKESADCSLAGPGRGDCFHFVGLPGKSIPNQHDGPDDTVDCYGKPNGWCWSCWKDYRLEQSRKDVERFKYVVLNGLIHGGGSVNLKFTFWCPLTYGQSVPEAIDHAMQQEQP